MDAVKLFKDSPITDKFLSAPDLIEQLKEQSRNLSIRVKSLEHYKLLCEQRIQELLPNHPLPLLEEHFGTITPILSELQFAKQKISRLESQISKGASLDSDSLEKKYFELLKEKTNIEESLRIEILTCEEQRTYIEILRQSIEEHGGEIREGKGGDIKRDYANLKNTAIDQQTQLEKLNGILGAMENEIEAVRADKEQLETHLKEAAEALQGAEDEVLKIEEEKTALLEYIDEHSQKEQEMEKEMNELGKFFEEMKQNYESTIRKVDEKHQETEKLESTLNQLEKENKQIVFNLKESQQNTVSMKKKIEEKEIVLKKAKEECASYERKNESLYANIETLNETLKETQQENENYLSEIERTKKSLSEKDIKIQAVKAEINGFVQENSSLKGKISRLELERENDQDEKFELERIYEEERKNLMEFKNKHMILSMKCEALEEDRKSRVETEKNLRLEIIKFGKIQDELSQSLYREKTLSEKIVEITGKVDGLNHEITRIYLENQRLESELSQKLQETECAVAKIKQFSSMCDELQIENKSLSKQLKDSKVLQKTMENQVDAIEKNQENCEAENEEIRFKIRVREKELENLNRQLSFAKDELEKVKSDFIDKKEEVFLQNSEIAQCLTSFISSFDGLPELDFPLFTLNFKKNLQVARSKSSIAELKILTESTVGEIKFLFGLVSDLKQEITTKNSELAMTLTRLEGLYSEVDSYKAKIHSLSQDCQYLNNSTSRDVNALKSEIGQLQKELENLDEENYSLKKSLQNTVAECQKLKNGSEKIMSNMREQEKISDMLRFEKKKLEEFINEQQEKIYLIEANNAHDETMRRKGELEVLERERYNIECQLLKLESDLRTKDSLIFRELSQKLMNCEGQIRNHRTCIYSLESALCTEKDTWTRKSPLKYSESNYIRYRESPPKRERSPYK